MNAFKRTANSLHEYLSCIDGFHKEAKPSSMATIPDEFLQTFYRGHMDKNYKCIPSVFRNGQLDSEARIYKKCVESFPYEFYNMDERFDQLSKIQHYGSATRILDFSINPLVSLFFACYGDNSKKETDGVVILYRTTHTTEDDIGVKSLAFLATYDGIVDEKFFNSLRDYLGKNYSDEYLLSAIQKSYFVIPNITNERLYRQNGVFLIFGQKDKGEKIGSCLDDNFGRGEEYPGYIGYITIPSEAKARILSELENEKITKDYLMPDIETEFKKIIEGCKQGANLR